MTRCLWRHAGAGAGAVIVLAAASPSTALAAGAASPPIAHAVARPASSTAALSVRSDFNGDGFADIAVGIPYAHGGVGAVSVLYGSASGLSTAGSQYWTLDGTGAGGRHGAAGDEFGLSIASGDLNGDGLADLAIGVPGKNAVVVLYGRPAGLRAAGSQYLPGFGPLGGFSLAVGDFTGDGVADLAVGEPFAAASRRAGAGTVEIHDGSPAGVTGVARGTAMRISETSFAGLGAGINDNFGLALAAGDFNGDGRADLAIGIPGQNVAVVAYGSSSGLRTSQFQFLLSFGAMGGFALAAGDFNGDGHDDLAVGEPGTQTVADSAGAIEVHYGSPHGLTKVSWGTAQIVTEITPGMSGSPTASNDQFGFALTVGDFNGDNVADLAVGVPGKSAATVLYGTTSGITTSHSQFLPGVGPQYTAAFAPSGLSVAAADFNGDGFADLVLGEPYTTTSHKLAGVAEVHAGSASGLTDVAIGSAPLLSEDTAGMAGPTSDAYDSFAYALAAAG